MVRKLSLICAVTAATLFPIPMFAVEGQGSDQGKEPSHGRGPMGTVMDMPTIMNMGTIMKYGHGHGHGHRGHWYHGRWWDYGVGPCWQWTPVGWIWICGY